MKVLVTGSRDWDNEKAIEREFAKLPKGTIIVHGHHWEGADKIADKLAMKMGFQIRRYPADWDGEKARTGSSAAAGPKRNSEMIRAEHPDKDGVPLDMGLAFATDLSRARGTKDCVTKARKAGVKVEVFSV
jgi:YspA, cpYpsA-related SLOG family